jgi:hypothetical protein
MASTIAAKFADVKCGVWCRDSSVRNPPQGQEEIFSSPLTTGRLWGPHSLPSIGYRELFSGLKRPGREADLSPAFSTKGKNGGAL